MRIQVQSQIGQPDSGAQNATLKTQKRQKAQKKKKIDYSLPLYLPHTKKIKNSSLKQWMNKEKHAEIEKWLASPEWYEAILRSRRRGHRTVFKNVVPEIDVQKIVAAGVMSKVGKNAKSSKAFVQLKSVNERSKNRRRLILETRCINREIKRNRWKFMKNINLPTHRKLEMAARGATSIEAIDFRSFFYQIELDEEVRRFFRVHVNGELYELNVLPMGSVFSTFVAQRISESVIEHLEQESDLAAYAYVDNLFFFSKNNITRKRECADFLPEVGMHEFGREIEVLGRVFNTERMTLRVTETFKDKVKLDAQNATEALTARGFLQVWGKIIFASQILHRPLANHFHAMRELAKVCSSVVSGFIDLDQSVGKMKHLPNIAAECCNWVNTENSIHDEIVTEEECTMISDASMKMSAFLIIKGDNVDMHAWSHNDDVHINILEARAAKKGIWKAWEQGESKIKWLTDSQVVKFVTNKGHSRNELLNEEIRGILECPAKISCDWIKSEENPADEPSREQNVNEEKVKTAIKKYANLEHEEIWFGKAWRGGR